MEWLVIFAEIFTVCWFVVYGLMLEKASREKPNPNKKYDVVEVYLIGNARGAFIIGIGTVIVLTVWEVYG